LDARVTAVALDLVARGVEPGDLVATVLGPTPAGVLAVHAVRRAGGVLAPLHPAWTDREIEAAMGALGPRCTLAEAAASEAGASRPDLTVDAGDGPAPLTPTDPSDGPAPLTPTDPSDGPVPLAGGEADRDSAPIASADREDGPAPPPTAVPGAAPLLASAPDPGTPSAAVLPGLAALPEVAAILWTSGTGGRPRGVELSARGLLHVAHASATRLGLEPADRWYASLHLAHVGGLALVVRAAVLGSAVVATEGFSAPELSRFLDDGTVTHASLVPVMLKALLEVRRGRLAHRRAGALLVGGANAPKELVEEALAADLPVALTYGMTEASSQVATASPSMVRERPDAVGPALDGVQLSVAPDGEVLVRGPTLALGYHGDPAPITDADGWYHTGDSGALDGDGYLRVTGRITERVITGGVTVDPAEVEAVIREAAGVADCAVVGLADERWGERVVAAVVPLPGEELDPRGLEAHQEARLSGAKRVRQWVLVEAIPRNPNGKVNRDAVRRLVSPDETP
jgi:O-succinylbenzoic acid--CoA ligase